MCRDSRFRRATFSSCDRATREPLPACSSTTGSICCRWPGSRHSCWVWSRGGAGASEQCPRGAGARSRLRTGGSLRESTARVAACADPGVERPASAPVEAEDVARRRPRAGHDRALTIRIEALRALARAARRARRYVDAASYWQEIVDTPGCPRTRRARSRRSARDPSRASRPRPRIGARASPCARSNTVRPRHDTKRSAIGWPASSEN